MDISKLRHEYRKRPLLKSHLNTSPFEQFRLWFEEAEEADLLEPNAMILSTASNEGTPSARTVLLKGFGEREGFKFYTNYESRKAKELKNGKGCLLFPWIEISRQVIVEGRAEKLSRELSSTYFHQRPRQSQLGAWASEQDKPIPSRESLDHAYLEKEREFEGQEIPLPPHWGGFALFPHRFEFWQGREKRLHDRFCYTLIDGAWVIERLSP